MSVDSAGTLLAREEVQGLLEGVLNRCQGQPAEVILHESDEALTRFAVNRIHQNVRAHRQLLTLRVFDGQRAGVSSTSRIDDQGLDELVARASEIARLSPENPDFGELPGPASYGTIDGFVPGTAECSADARADKVGVVVDQVKREGLEVAGALTTASRAAAVANSNGVFAYHPSTYSQFTCTVQGEDSSGWVDAHSRDVESIDTAGLGRIAIEKTVRSAKPVALPAGKYTVVLEPNAVAELVAFLGWLGFGAQSYQEGQSFLNGRMGEKVTGENIQIVDDAFDPRSLGMPFDYEGVPRQKVNLVQNGVSKGLVYDTVTARKDGVKATGHALTPPNPEGPLPYDLVLSPGEASLEDLIAATDNGILVTRFWYNRVVDPRNTVITGMTRDGTFLIEKGQVTKGIRNFRFNESVLDVLARAAMIGAPAQPTVFDYVFNCVVAPPLQVTDFNFTGVTEF
jgi:predicted Zn-dependent protease